ncbi:hypothetical protein [Xenorhabdus sp. IM139775]|uniref:hypothetical protein n=1 Tax=Xenorhabdus sp. IM139775 TaxID=3025876 RepID=UPI0023592226|nr:hypothetical protein [Xenorhabdus sp. IM139775]MDC9593005.1 hypothetical protein [Xenorhabdus sp. IM139775]
MSKYIITYNGLDNNNAVIVSSQISLDIDVNLATAADFLGQFSTNAYNQAVALNGNVVRVVIVRIYGL